MIPRVEMLLFVAALALAVAASARDTNTTSTVTVPITRIFLRRMRKAGSTTVFGYFLGVSKVLDAADSAVIYDRMEYQVLL